MIYELPGRALEEPIPHPEGLPALLDQYPRVKAAVGKLRRGEGRDPIQELMLLRRCAPPRNSHRSHAPLKKHEMYRTSQSCMRKA
jgi:hypothetical protein